jgi:hypothetical protein
MATYYVSSIIGSDNNAGTSGSAPLASLQAAENLVNPGDTVEVMNGTYGGPAGGNVLTISTSGTAGAPITFEAAPGATPVINSSGSWQGIEIDASYITINGFTVVGDAANYNLASATAGYGTGNANLDGNGIAATSGELVHNLIIENNIIYNEPGGGIGIGNGDYIQILNNNVHDNAHWSAFGDSGISIAGSQNFDNGPAPHIIIEGNTSINNAELVPEYRAGAITDGEGIILDSNDGYTGGFLVENNTVYGNGSSGIESFLTNNATITGNTVFGNNTETVQPASNAEIFLNQSNNNTVTNNTTASPLSPDNTTIPAVAVESSMYGAVGSSAEITKLTTEFLPPQIAEALQHGFNPQVYASEALGLAFAFGNENGSSAFANAFGPANVSMPTSPAGDSAFAAAAASTIFGSASTANLVNVIDGFVANWESFYTSNGIPGHANASPAQLDLAARGAAWGDAVGVALANNLGPLLAEVTNFLQDAAQGTAVYSAPLTSQPNNNVSQGATPSTSSASEVQVMGVAHHLDQAMI